MRLASLDEFYAMLIYGSLSVESEVVSVVSRADRAILTFLCCEHGLLSAATQG